VHGEVRGDRVVRVQDGTDAQKLPAAARVAEAAREATAEQCGRRLPVRRDFFCGEDLGEDAEEVDASDDNISLASEDGDDDIGAASEDEEDASTGSEGQESEDGDEGDKGGTLHVGGKNRVGGGDAQKRTRPQSAVEPESCEDDEDEDGGYGQGGLSWEAVMAQVINAVRAFAAVAWCMWCM
jgi:nuclear GTP-binding protein